MKIHLRADEANGIHTKITFFLNGVNCGKLVVSENDAANLHQIISYGCIKEVDEFLSSGQWAK